MLKVPLKRVPSWGLLGRNPSGRMDFKNPKKTEARVEKKREVGYAEVEDRGIGPRLEREPLGAFSDCPRGRSI